VNAPTNQTGGVSERLPIGAVLLIEKTAFFYVGRLMADGVSVQVSQPDLLGLTARLVGRWHSARRERCTAASATAAPSAAPAS